MIEFLSVVAVFGFVVLVAWSTDRVSKRRKKEGRQ